MKPGFERTCWSAALAPKGTTLLERLRLLVDGALNAAVMVDALRSTVPVPVRVPSASSNRPVPPRMVPVVKLTSQIVVQVGSSAEPPKSTKSRSPFAALNLAVPEKVLAAKFTQCG